MTLCACLTPTHLQELDLERVKQLKLHTNSRTNHHNVQIISVVTK